jgi:AcrR family transcriptional regulator
VSSSTNSHRQSGGGGHGGRPRDPSRDKAILQAALDVLAEDGYDRLTIDAVASRAGAGRATVYRRWESKAELVVDALADLHGSPQVPDTGSLREDLDQLCAHLTDDPESRTLAVMQGLASALPHDPTLVAAFNERLGDPRRAAVAELFARAVARGEMPPGKDIELLTSVIPALMMHRLLTGEGRPSLAFARRIVEQLLLPAATRPVWSKTAGSTGLSPTAPASSPTVHTRAATRQDRSPQQHTAASLEPTSPT